MIDKIDEMIEKYKLKQTKIEEYCKYKELPVSLLIEIDYFLSDLKELKKLAEEDQLTEWPCQQLLGGTGSAIYMNENGMCKHPECHPRNNDKKLVEEKK